MGKNEKVLKVDTIFDNGLVEVECGTIDKSSSDVIFLTMKCWICPTREVDGVRVCSFVERSLRREFSNAVCGKNGFGDKLILDFDVVSDNMSVGCKRFLLVEAFVTYTGKGVESARKCLSEIVPEIVGDMVFDFRERGVSVSRKK